MMRIRTEIIMRKEAGAKSRIITLN
jgi:hypothetical protein